MCLELTVAENAIQTLNSENLPQNWRESPPTESTQNIGDEWINSNSSLALLIPSVVVPQEYNAIINPLHPEFTELTQTAQNIPIAFDLKLSV